MSNMPLPEAPGEHPAEASPLALSILQLLDEHPMHPYELASTMRERHMDEFIRLNFGSLYHTVEVLERNGWITPSEREKAGRRPERTVYQLTKSGNEVLMSVVGDILARPRREYPQFTAGLMFMHHLDAAHAAERLRERAVALSAVAAKLTAILADLQSHGLKRLALVEMEHKIAMLEAERSWVLKIAKEIDEGRMEWSTGSVHDVEGLRRKHGSSAH
jgi:DNA-binding PadR family transcriptional regulator